MSPVGPAPTITTGTDSLTWMPVSETGCPASVAGRSFSLIGSVSFIEGAMYSAHIKDTFEGYPGSTIWSVTYTSTRTAFDLAMCAGAGSAIIRRPYFGRSVI